MFDPVKAHVEPNQIWPPLSKGTWHLSTPRSDLDNIGINCGCFGCTESISDGFAEIRSSISHSGEKSKANISSN